MRRRIVAFLVLAGFCAALLLLNRFLPADTPTWTQISAQGCRSNVFQWPPSMMPPELVTLLDDSARQRDAQLRSELLVAINEFAGEAFPGTPININCEQSPYDPAAINIYFVARDPDQQYL